MKICFAVDNMGGGGAERVVSVLGNYFAEKLNYEITILMVSWDKCETKYELSSKIKLIPLIKQEKDRLPFRRIRILRQELDKIKPDITICFLSHITIYVCLANLFNKRAIICSERSNPKSYPFLKKMLLKVGYRRANYVVFQTNEAKDYYAKIVSEKSSVIFNPINDVFFNKFQSTSKRSGFVFCGRLDGNKNVLSIIEDFFQISDSVNDNLYIYGSGPLEKQIINKISELNMQNRIFLMGFSECIHQEYSKYKVFLMKSIYEGMPNSLMEAMASGLVCISTDCPIGGPRALIKNLVNGYLVKPGCDSEFQKAMLDAIKNDNDEMITYNIGFCKQFNADNVAQKWDKIIKLLTKKIEN